jgi:hypothetical protein
MSKILVTKCQIKGIEIGTWLITGIFKTKERLESIKRNRQWVQHREYNKYETGGYYAG